MKNFRLAALSVLTSVLALPGHSQDTSYVEVPVVTSEPIVEVITRKIPHEQCHDVESRFVEPTGAHSPTPGLLGTAIGGVVGGAAGHDSRYQPLLIGAGALLGASIGTDVAHRRSAQSYYVTRRRCGIDYELRDSERV
ncbi:MAG TPA: hypothetical protein VIV27_03240, partial [Halioglobus sp.]